MILGFCFSSWYQSFQNSIRRLLIFLFFFFLFPDLPPPKAHPDLPEPPQVEPSPGSAEHPRASLRLLHLTEASLNLAEALRGFPLPPWTYMQPGEASLMTCMASHASWLLPWGTVELFLLRRFLFCLFLLVVAGSSYRLVFTGYF